MFQQASTQCVPRTECAYNNRLVLVFRGEAHIVGESCGDAQVDPAPRGFLAKEIGLHLDVAVAEQENIDALESAAEIRDLIRCARRPP